MKALAWEWPEDGKTVVVKGTGRAAGKVLELAGELRKRGECEVRVRTGTVGAVDDLTVVKKKRRVEAGGGGVEVDDEEEEEGEVEEKTVQRGVSVVELLVRKR